MRKTKPFLQTAIIAIFALTVIGISTSVAAGNEKPALGSRGNGTLCTDHFPARSAQSAGAAATMAKQGGKEQAASSAFPPYPYEDTFLLHSYPSSSYKLYIDFDGYIDGQYVYTAWDIDGDDTTFSEAERLLIQKMWFLTSEDFMPFTIDVTTEEPGPGFPGMRCVVDGSEMYSYGWAYRGTWPDSDTYCYSGIWDNDWIWIAQAVSHEVGHTLNLLDHGDDTTGYYMGHGEGWTQWGVIMGWDSWSLGVWDDGDYPNANNPEDSLAIIIGSANPGVDYRPDDHGSDISTATAITLPATLELVAEGVIEQRTDLDYFAFTTLGGNIHFSINEDVVMGCTNLDILAKIHDSEGAVLYEANPLWEIWASFDVTLAPGDYYLSIDGTGQDHPDGEPSEGFGYSDYGILGYYSIKASQQDTDPTLPDVDAGGDMITWSGQAMQLAPTVINNGALSLTYAWSAIPDTGVAFDPDSAVETPTVTITKATDNPSAVTLTLNVNGVKDTMAIDVYDDACLAARIGLDLAEDNPTDFDENCITDLHDLAVIAETWLVDIALTEPILK